LLHLKVGTVLKVLRKAWVLEEKYSQRNFSSFRSKPRFLTYWNFSVTALEQLHWSSSHIFTVTFSLSHSHCHVITVTFSLSHYHWFYRNARGHSYLRDMLNPLITSLLEDTSVKINTNPTEVYKNWVNQQETDSGVPRLVLIKHLLVCTWG